MKRYNVRPEYFSLWGEDVTEDTVITEEELARLAEEWEKPVSELLEQLTDAGPAMISIDNGHSFVTPDEALQFVSMDTIAAFMDDDTREQVHMEIAPCSDIDFLTRYLEIAPDDLIIG